MLTTTSLSAAAQGGAVEQIERVHVVFKTHLDVGFTELPAKVVDRYIDDFFPRAIKLSQELGTGERGFVWTSGSWILSQVLGARTQERRDAVEAAVRDGGLAWHATPFTTQSEVLDASLFDYGLSLARDLDARFGRKTTVAKMTDVPGHTIGIVPVLARGGVEFLHIGVNPASQVPSVPPCFIWKAPTGEETVVIYDRSYGSSAKEGGYVLPGGREALFISFTNDNIGPPTADDVLGLHEQLAKRFPGAEIVASTLEDFWRGSRHLRSALPVVTSEIGDSWIHGIASDPAHLSRFQRLKRQRRAWELDGRLVPGTRAHSAVSEPLILVGEHTWGLDFKSWLPDFLHLRKDDFTEARRRDVFDLDSNIDSLEWTTAWARQRGHLSPRYSVIEASWHQQHEYVEAARDGLPESLQREFGGLPTAASADDDAQPVVGRQTIRGVELEIGGNGALVWLVADGRQWADAAHPIGEYIYETFAAAEYDRWIEEYVRDIETTHAWATCDLGRPGLAPFEPEEDARKFFSTVESASWWPVDDGFCVRVVAHVPDDAVTVYGAPGRVETDYLFDGKGLERVILRLSERQLSRLPDASWFRISPLAQSPGQWTMTTMGTTIPVDDVVAGGNRNLHAVESIAYESPTGRIRIEPVDSPLVAPGEGRLLRADESYPDIEKGPHFLLHNNLWSTNYKMWSDDDLAFEFGLELARQ